MPRSTEANQALRDTTRAAILKAAVRLFSRRGFGGTSVRALADEADIALGLLYSHFESKEAVLAALMQDSVLDVSSTLEVAETQPTAKAYVEALLRSAIPLLQQHHDAWRLSYALRHQPEVLGPFATKLQRYSSQIAERLAAGLKTRGVPNPAIEAALLFALVDGVGQHFLQQPRRYPIDEVIAAAADRYAVFSPRPRKKA